MIQQIDIATKKQEVSAIIQLYYMKFPLIFLLVLLRRRQAGWPLRILYHALLLWSVEVMFQSQSVLLNNICMTAAAVSDSG